MKIYIHGYIMAKNKQQSLNLRIPVGSYKKIFG